MKAIQDIRFLFPGWKRFLVSIQRIHTLFLWAIFLLLIFLPTPSGNEWKEGRATLILLSGIFSFSSFFLHKTRLLYLRFLSGFGLFIGTLLWIQFVFPVISIPFLNLNLFEKSGWNPFILTSLSCIFLFGIGYPFPWLSRIRYGWMIGSGLFIATLGFLILQGMVILERNSLSIHSYDILMASLSMILIGISILIQCIQDCLEEGTLYWSFIPFSSAALMFLITMTLWTAFQVHEKRTWNREVESFSIKMQDRLEQKLISLRQDLERLCLTASLQQEISLADWQLQTQVFLLHEPTILGFERLPLPSPRWNIPRFADLNWTEKLPFPDIQETLRKSRQNKSIGATPPFSLKNSKHAIVFVGFIENKSDAPWWILMGIDFSTLAETLFKEESLQLNLKVLINDSYVVRDFDETVNLNRESPFISEFYLSGLHIKIFSLPKEKFFLKRDQFLSFGFMVAGILFSTLFGLLVWLYIQTHLDSMTLRSANELLAHEIKDRRDAESETDRRNKDLETLIYVVSHDLREPLRGIESFSRLIYERYLDRLDEKGQDFLRRIVFSSMRLDRLMDDITTLSRAQRAEPPSSSIPAQDLIMEALSRLETVIKAKEAKIEIDRNLPNLYVNRTWGTQAIFNLLGNALKFTKPQEIPNIHIRAYHDPSGVTTGIQVLDRGPGVSPEHVERIFKLFQRAVGRDVEGTGAGLTIVKQITEQHGGDTWYEDREGGGSCFTITFAQKEKPTTPHE